MPNILRMIVAMAAGTRRSVEDIDSEAFKNSEPAPVPEVRF